MDNVFNQEDQEVFNEDCSVLEQASTPPVSPPKRRGLDNAKDGLAMYKEASESALKSLYDNDPLVRAGIQAQLASEQMQVSLKKERLSNVSYDANGSLTGVTKSVLSGPNATAKNQQDLWHALVKDMSKKLGVTL